MVREVDIPWVKGVDIPLVGGRNTIYRRVDIPSIGGSIYHG